MIWRILGVLLGLKVLWLMLGAGMVVCGPSVEGGEADAVRSLIDWHVQEHDGRLPESWEDLAPHMNGLSGAAWLRFARRYEIFSPPVVLAMEDDAFHGTAVAVVAMHRRGVYDTHADGRLSGPGRFLIFRQAGDGWRSLWMEEKKVVAAFAAAGEVLPVPDTEPDRPQTRNARRWRCFWWGLWAVLGGWAVVDLVCRWRNRRLFLKGDFA